MVSAIPMRAPIAHYFIALIACRYAA
jgi:hypothetical protein